MKVKDFNGKQYNWPPEGYIPKLNNTRQCSALHFRVRNILHKLYPTAPILEEVPLPGIGLIADFYLPIRKVMVECQGEQHYKFILHFHRDKQAFVAAQNRDNRKKEWCKLNNIRMAILPYLETDDEFKERINNAEDC